MQDKEINHRFEEFGKRLEKVENVRTGEPLVDSPFDRKLTNIAENISGIKSDLGILGERVNIHIKVFWACVGTLFTFAIIGLGAFIDIRGTLVHIQDSLPSGQLRNMGSGPLNENKLQQVENIVERAKSSGTLIEPKLVNQVGQRMIAETQRNPNLANAAWQTATKLMEYRSFLNAGTAKPPNLNKATCIKLVNVEGIAMRVTHSSLMNCVQELDHIEWRDTVFENVTILYHGGPVIFENVQFRNCIFVLDYTPPSKELGQALVSSSSVTLRLATSPS